MNAFLAAGLFLILTGASATAHQGDLDEFGGHIDERSGHYHYHKPAWDLAKRSKEFVNWTRPGVSGELAGTFERVERPDAIWVRIPYRPAFQNFAAHVSSQNRNDKDALLRIWFRFISPENSALTQDREYIEWFRKKVVFELDRKLAKQPVTVQFVIDPVTRRPQGMVLLGEENVNIWLVLNGWSFYLLNEEKGPYDKAFTDAELTARKQKAGLWGRGG